MITKSILKLIKQFIELVTGLFAYVNSLLRRLHASNDQPRHRRLQPSVRVLPHHDYFVQYFIRRHIHKPLALVSGVIHWSCWQRTEPVLPQNLLRLGLWTVAWESGWDEAPKYLPRTERFAVVRAQKDWRRTAEPLEAVMERDDPSDSTYLCSCHHLFHRLGAMEDVQYLWERSEEGESVEVPLHPCCSQHCNSLLLNCVHVDFKVRFHLL